MDNGAKPGYSFGGELGRGRSLGSLQRLRSREEPGGEPAGTRGQRRAKASRCTGRSAPAREAQGLDAGTWCTQHLPHRAPCRQARAWGLGGRRPAGAGGDAPGSGVTRAPTGWGRGQALVLSAAEVRHGDLRPRGTGGKTQKRQHIPSGRAPAHQERSCQESHTICSSGSISMSRAATLLPR